MKPLIFLLSVICLAATVSAQSTNSHVDEAEKLIKSGFPKDAMTKLETAFKTINCKDDAHLFVKAHLLYISAISAYEEDAIQKSIKHLTDCLPQCATPEAQIFHSYLGELYMNYSENNYPERKDLDAVGDDITTWSKAQIERKALAHFRASMANPENLFKIPVFDYKIILTEGKGVEKYRPTLYDIIAHRFLDNCSKKSTVTEYPDLKNAFPDFLKMTWSPDTSSFASLAVTTYQNLLRFHEKNNDPSALIQADLDRISFFNVENKDFTAYDYLLKTYQSHPAVALAAFQKAEILYHKTQYFGLDNQIDENNTQEAVKAAEICKTYSEKFPDSDGGKNCATLLKEIEFQEVLSVSVEGVILPSKLSLAQATFRNINQLTCRIYKVPESQSSFDQDDMSDGELKKIMTDNQPVKEWNVLIPNPNDYLVHSMEFEVSELKYGEYLLIVSKDETISLEKSPFFSRIFQVSSLFPIYTSATGKFGCFMVADRITGHPLKGVSIRIFDRNKSKNLLETLTTDENGIAYLSKVYNTTLQAVFSLKEDVLTSDHIWNSKGYDQQQKDYLSVKLFTDRAIYRPGQTVYFKGVAMNISETMVTLKTREIINVGIRDVNYQEILKFQFITDEMGGFDGSFTIPADILTGNMTIQTPNGSTSFLVEEYKRPRFEVTFDKMKESYQLNEEVKMTGKAMMLNGLPLENANVNFEISRFSFKPFRYYWGNSSEIISTGTTTTKADGTFEVVFKTVANQEDKGRDFYYTFSVSADVTDMTGETQSGTASIGVGTKSVKINFDVPKLIIGLENDEIEFSFTNYDGEKISASGTLTIEELKQPQTPFIERFWKIPDLKSMSKEEFSKKFPQYQYENDSLPVLKQIYSAAIANSEKGTLKLNEKITKSGSYCITISVDDKSGKKVSQTMDFTFLKKDEKTLQVAQNAMFNIPKESYEFGETAKIFIGSGSKNAKAYYTIVDSKGIRKQSWMDVGQKLTTVEIPIDASLEPWFTINVQLIQNNRLYTFSQNVPVINPVKKLNIEVTGVRDKTLPGAKERWELKITDKDGKPVQTALFSSMYDASLDKFSALSWSFSATPNYKMASFSSNDLTKSFLYGARQMNQIYSNPTYIIPDFEAFNWFGYDFYSLRGLGGIMYKNMLVAEMAVPPTRMETAGVKEEMAFDSETDLREEIVLPTITQTPEPVRQNFSETAFFYPNLRTDEKGSVILEFVMPETLTRWNMQAIGYSNTLQIGDFKQFIVTESDFMVMPNLPRYLRVGDTCVLIARIANRTDKILSGTAKIVVENMITGASLQENVLGSVEIPFSVKGNESITVSWKYRQPDNAEALKIRMTATSGNFTDGEEHLMPVLPSQVILQETLALEMAKSGTATYTFKNLTQENKPQKLTVELSTSPVWFAIQSLPTLSEYPYESNDQIFNRYYSAAFGSYILNSMPEIKNVFDQWRNLKPDALLSNLEKNQDLKNLLLAETPWVMDAQNETARKQRLATLFDVNALTYSLNQAVQKLQQRQLSDGGFSWYPDMKSSPHITRYIVTGIGKLNALNIKNQTLNYIAKQAIQYLDTDWMEHYETATKKGATYVASSSDVLYLYARSFFQEQNFDDKQTQILTTIVNDCVKKQTEFDFNTRAMLALVLQRRSQTLDAQKISNSLDNNSIGDINTGKYWRSQQGNVSASGIDLSALMVEVYNEVLNNKTAADEVLTWLLRNKRTNDWVTPIATADAVYALVSSSKTVLEPAQATLKVGNETVKPNNQEAGTGYFQVIYDKNEIKPEMKTITVTSAQDKQIWGGAYLQYQSSVDKVKGDKNAPLSIERELYKRSGSQWAKIASGASLQVGDKVIVRLTLKANRDFEYVHVRDMKAASFEPVDQMSGYTWNTQLGYYRSMRDAVVDMFFDRVPRGTWVVEYEVFVTQSGTFSNGFSSVQCFYAPEFSNVSDGNKVKIQ